MKGKDQRWSSRSSWSSIGKERTSAGPTAAGEIAVEREKPALVLLPAAAEVALEGEGPQGGVLRTQTDRGNRT